jgi:hypothetical protein
MMYATLVSSDPRSSSIARRKRLITGLVIALLLACTDLRSAQPFDSTPFDSAQGRPSDSAQGRQGRPWRDAPEYLRLFAPLAHREDYRVYVSPLGLDETLKAVLADPAVHRPSGAWDPRPMIPFDAFGRTGSYNRWQLAGVYGSRRARVARGPRDDHGRSESWMLVAPYPDPALQHLEPGTLIIVLTIPPA